MQNFEEYLLTDVGSQSIPTTTTAPPPTAHITMHPIDITAIKTAVSMAMLAKPPGSKMDIFMKNKGGGDEVNVQKRPKQWNTWQQNFLLIAHSYDFKDITDDAFTPDMMGADVDTVFELQEKHAFRLLVTNVKELSAFPVVQKHSDPDATHYGDAQCLYKDLIAHYTHGLSGVQHLETLKQELNGSIWIRNGESPANFHQHGG